MNFEEKTKNQGTSQPEASQEEKVNGDMASWEELVELDDVQRRTVVGGADRLERGADRLDIERLIRQSGVDPFAIFPRI
jgi:hypothetical protein